MQEGVLARNSRLDTRHNCDQTTKTKLRQENKLANCPISTTQYRPMFHSGPLSLSPTLRAYE
ncbi:hypothetical protein BLOT_014340 [Blomia tropicalis]|nr:hypothetical protein BLOT_014340 [Blomia tropicalis]